MTDVAAAPLPAKASALHELEVLWVRHWTDQLFSFAIARPDDFRFRSGGEERAASVIRGFIKRCGGEGEAVPATRPAPSTR